MDDFDEYSKLERHLLDYIRTNDISPETYMPLAASIMVNGARDAGIDPQGLKLIADHVSDVAIQTLMRHTGG